MAEDAAVGRSRAFQAILLAAVTYAIGALGVSSLAQGADHAGAAELAVRAAGLFALALILASISQRAIARYRSALTRGELAQDEARSRSWRTRTALVLIKLAMLVAVALVGLLLAVLLLLGSEFRIVVNATFVLLALNILLSLGGAVAGLMLQGR